MLYVRVHISETWHFNLFVVYTIQYCIHVRGKHKFYYFKMCKQYAYIYNKHIEIYYSNYYTQHLRSYTFVHLRNASILVGYCCNQPHLLTANQTLSLHTYCTVHTLGWDEIDLLGWDEMGRNRFVRVGRNGTKKIYFLT